MQPQIGQQESQHESPLTFWHLQIMLGHRGVKSEKEATTMYASCKGTMSIPQRYMMT